MALRIVCIWSAQSSTSYHLKAHLGCPSLPTFLPLSLTSRILLFLFQPSLLKCSLGRYPASCLSSARSLRSVNLLSVTSVETLWLCLQSFILSLPSLALQVGYSLLWLSYKMVSVYAALPKDRRLEEPGGGDSPQSVNTLAHDGEPWMLKNSHASRSDDSF